MPPKTPAGYSGTPLAKKLGIAEGARVLVVEAPADYDALVDPLPPGVVVDVKVCAVDATWSGVKLVVRKALRA